MGEQLLLLQDVEELQGHSTGQWASAESGPMHSRMHALRNFLAGQQSPQGQAAGNGFGNGHQIGLDAIMLVTKPASGAPQPALDLVRNQQRMVFLRQPVRRLREPLTHRADSPFSLYELK